jgi:glucose/arabinose dehydrogenase
LIITTAMAMAATLAALSGFAQAWGCPVGSAIDGKGALPVADDVGNAVWRVTGPAR